MNRHNLDSFGNKRNVQDIFVTDLPEGVPCLKWKNGAYYRPDNVGYTTNLLQAGLYSRKDVIEDCFYNGKGKNGKFEVYAMPLGMAFRQDYLSLKRIDEYIERLNIFKKYCKYKSFDTTIF